MDGRTTTVTRLGVVTACAAFVLIGALQALYGPAISALRAGFGITLPTAGLAVSAQFVGGVAGVLGYVRARRVVTVPVLLCGSLLAVAGGATGFALVSSWPVALGFAFLAGLGFGGIDYGLNDLFATAFTRRGPAMLNVLNAHFGVGAIAGPFLVALLGPDRYPAVFLGLAGASLLLLPGLRGVHTSRRDAGTPPAGHPAEPADLAGHPAGPSATATPGDPAGRPAPSAKLVRRGAAALLIAFVALYVLNVGVETGVGSWEPTHLEAIGHSAASAASATSAYWLMLTVGRFLVIPLTLRWSDRAIVVGSCLGMAACLGLATVPALATVAYAGVGLFIAPVFPTGLPWLHRAIPGARQAGAYVIAASMLGGVAFPPVLGVAIERIGTSSVPALLFGLNALCLAVIWWIVKAERRSTHDRPAGRPAGDRTAV
jgi:FHS family glucose/mannose:H+ symporter-like MFS transporter